MSGNECVSKCLFLRSYSCAQTLDRGERCLESDLQ